VVFNFFIVYKGNDSVVTLGGRSENRKHQLLNNQNEMFYDFLFEHVVVCSFPTIYSSQHRTISICGASFAMLL